ncbi:hypothetical protein OSB04_016248 [Centaurea solstitialis]|uniref:Protein kinase domain-containing protein n=1 Tax=Centaurea solstitialis TaxID=347529 RepID=A0AA38TKK8_9ASTR|nr:hypothetical protein OSB04_016248 [Centaurea solstitialis]
MLPATPKEEEPLFRVEDQLRRRFSFAEIRSATQNFHDSLVVGRGGFGKVYKGFIKDGYNTIVVAIKISNSMSNQGALEFQAEVEMLSKIRHCNLVSLIGYSYEGKEMALVYEYMPQGTLEDHLYKDASPLSWLQLLKICKGAACGLDYLHTGTGTHQHGIIHRDVKSSNVLLDNNFAAKISDFGLAKIGPTNQTHTHVVLWSKAHLVICGRPTVDTSLDEDQWGLAPWAQDRIKEGKLNSIIDSRLRGEISSSCLKALARIACCCVDNNPNKRPTMGEIIGNLDDILSLQERLDSSATDGNFIDKFQRFFRAKVESKSNKLKPFSYNVLKMATRNFRRDTVVGEGDFGIVFKGGLTSSLLKHPSLADIYHLSMLNHPNLVKLIGYCLEDDQRFLVYDFIRHGSLEHHLFIRGTEPLSWKLRMKIAIGVAKGLAYIHNHESKMICCDIMSSSILLDYDYNAKLSDLWWRKHKVGPEYHHYKYKLFVDELDAIGAPTCCSSSREEIYNFGVVLLEIFTGKRNIDYSSPIHERTQVDFIRPCLDNKRGIKRIVDDRIDGQYTTRVAIRFARLVKRCLSKEPMNRPTADEVVKALEKVQDIQKTSPSPRVGKVTSATTSTSANVQKNQLLEPAVLDVKHFSFNNHLPHPIQATRATKAMIPATPKEEEPLFLDEVQVCRRFSLDEIRSATQNFDDSLVVGRGGFGKVYKGSIMDSSNTVVAIKISNSMSNQGTLEFQAEVKMLSKIRHCNLVSLIGYSYEGKEMALVYEYMPQGTLEDHLYKDGSPLSWLELLKICKGAARGLDYLHTGTGTQHGIIHRDVKSSNVLLDNNFVAKISDFGLAKIGPTNQTLTHVSTLVKGTFGYIDPRYFHTGKLTIKSDVYSFGVLLLEVLCGRPAVDTSLDEEQWGLAPWAQDRIKEGKLNSIIDSRLRGQISSNCLKGFARIACCCLDNNPNQRPTMAWIIGKLDDILSLQEKLDSSITEGKFIDKFQSFFRAKVESKAGKLKPFSYNVLKMATRNFRSDSILAEGNLGSVFKGWFDEQFLEAARPDIGTVFAVQRLNQQSDQDDKEWLAEINHLSMLNHPNLVKLIGYCLNYDQRLLVYDFIPRGSLADHLFRSEFLHYNLYPNLSILTRDPDIVPLPWNLRMKIVLGAAKGLAYIHNKEPKMICFDIKSCCILVDSDYNAKLSNRLWGMHEPLVPEYHFSVLFVDELDSRDIPTGCAITREEIYSFGVILLEAFTGEQIFHHDRPPSCERLNVNSFRCCLHSEQEIMRIIDDRIDGQYTTSLAIKFATIIRSCLSTEPSYRPNADEVVNALEALQEIPKTAPTPSGGKES